MRSVIVILLGIALTAGHIFAVDPIDFDRTVAPILSSRCLDCHNSNETKGKLDLSSAKGMKTGGKNSPVVVPGQANESLLWQRIAGNEMPPKHQLPERERAIIKEWIAQGAKWGTDPIDPYQFTSSTRAGKDWWSFQPLKSSTIPSRFKNPIDAMIANGLTEKKIKPSLPADRRTLIRRVYFDLIGLPPSPKEIADFESDRSPNSYEKLIDRLLSSPHYGERWARHWLDVAHFGESDGYEYDKMRPNAWRYRDWVIKAFNENMPYDQFAKWQIAGDVLKPNDSSSITATGFLVGGSFDGLQPAGEPLRQIMRQDELEDLVGLVSQSFLGLTVHCARCHDHKFDPIRQTDYYRFASALSGIRRGDRVLPNQIVPPELTKKIEELKRKLKEIEEPARLALETTQPQKSNLQVVPQPIATWDFSKGINDVVHHLPGKLVGGAKIEDGELVLSGQSYFASDPLTQNLKEKTLSAWLKLADFDQHGGGVIGIQSLDGSVFDSITYAEKNPSQWMAGSNFYLRTRPFHGPKEQDAVSNWVHIAISYASDGTITAYRNGLPYGKAYKSEKVASFASGEYQVILGIRHLPAGGDRHLSGRIQKAQLFDRALTPAEIAASYEANGQGISEWLAKLSPSQREQRKQILSDLAQGEEKIKSIREAQVYAVTPRQPDITHVLKRGNPQQKAEPISAGGLSVLANEQFGLTPDAPESVRRVKLADWIANPKNPLFARTMVNRVWQHHFGRGLVDTPNDLGFSGGQPSNQLLLDWLANEFMQSQFNIKQLHRLILTSQTFQQSSAARADSIAIDAENRLLWRYSPRRQEAEVIRDSMLSISGQLNPKQGGPGYLDVRPYFFRGSQFYEPIDSEGPESNRRTIYRMSARGGKNALLDTFDCPDTATITPKRGQTTTPLQALSLMNGTFTLRMADQFAERLKNDAGKEVDKQIDLAFEWTYGRLPKESERTASQEVIAQHGLAPFCRAMFNTNGFLYVH